MHMQSTVQSDHVPASRYGSAKQSSVHTAGCYSEQQPVRLYRRACANFPLCLQPFCLAAFRSMLPSSLMLRSSARTSCAQHTSPVAKNAASSALAARMLQHMCRQCAADLGQAERDPLTCMVNY